MVVDRARPESYARRIRARPYGPRELAVDGVAAWFHGPFAVLTLTGGEAGLTVRADVDTASLGADLRHLFTAAENAAIACLPRPERMVAEQPIGDDVLVVVRRLEVCPAAEGVSLILCTADRTVKVMLGMRDAGRLAAEVRRWAGA
ncbi:hypothetical protein [Actinomadura chibensis]|uniref:Uncharacterized protein n=1 Tax=Actinomadura chibensis TaxID=392828 RepID=A0A5D0NMN1_9ACTN|nr:hypothetical protein [Actinomadura chibensis]TYB45549.1 hypothetical protein FXF69_19165 [Actinomadura chibensis]